MAIDNVALSTAVALRGLTQRDLSLETGIRENRISELKKRAGSPPTPAEKAALSKALGTPADLLFPSTGPVYVKKGGELHLSAAGAQAEIAAVVGLLEKAIAGPGWAGREGERLNAIAGLLQLRRAAGLSRAER